MTRTLAEAEALITELLAKNGQLELDNQELTNRVEYYKGIARQNEDILRETGLATWFSGKPEEVAEKIEEIKSRYTKGQHMEIFEAVIKENPVVADAWNRFMASLRLCGYDGSREVE